MRETAETASTGRASASTVERHSDIDAVRDDWRALAERSGNVFMTWEWADAWRRHLGARFPLITLVVRRGDGTAQAVVPLYRQRERPVRVLRLVGVGPSDELGPICAPEDRVGTALALAAHADALLAPGGILLAERLGCRPSLATALGGVVIQRAATPLIHFGGKSFDDYLATRSANFRSQLRRSERRLAREHRLSYRLTTDPAELERDLDALIRLHQSRWADGASNAFTGARAAFHRDFARRALDNRWLRLWTAELDGKPAAVWYGLRFGGVDHYYQSGRDPELASLKIGFVLQCHTIRSACEDGMSEYRFGLGDEAYKNRFSNGDPGLETVATAGGLRGRLGLAALRAGLRGRDLARRQRLTGRIAAKAGRRSPGG